MPPSWLWPFIELKSPIETISTKQDTRRWTSHITWWSRSVISSSWLITWIKEGVCVAGHLSQSMPLMIAKMDFVQAKNLNDACSDCTLLLDEKILRFRYVQTTQIRSRSALMLYSSGVDVEECPEWSRGIDGQGSVSPLTRTFASPKLFYLMPLASLSAYVPGSVFWHD